MLWSSVPQPVNTNDTIPAGEYIDFGWHIIPVSKNKIPLVKGWVTRQPSLDEFPAGCRFSQVTGPQPDGSFVIGPEFDHKPDEGIDATANFQAFIERISEPLFLKLHITRSTGGLGFHIRAVVPRPVASSIIRNTAGKKIGDLRAAGGHLVIQQPDKWLHGAPWTMKTLSEPELDELLAALNYQAPVTPGTSTLDWSAAKAISVAHLLTNGIPSRFSPTCQGAHYLRNAIPAQHSSDIRFALVGELIRCEYTDEEVAALALHFGDLGAIKRKGLAWVENDIDRIIRKIRASGPQPRYKPKQTRIEIDDDGQPMHKHEAPYLFWLSTHLDGGKVMMSRPERATSYGVSLRTLDRIETDLIARGKIKRGLSADRRIAWVEPAAPSGTAKPPDTHIDLDTTEAVLTGGVWGGGSTEDVSAPEMPLLAHVVEDAIEALGESRVRKRRADIILGLVRAYIPDADPEQVAWLAKHAIDWRRQRRADDRLREQLDKLTRIQLKAKLRSLSGKAGDLHGQCKPRQAWVFGRLAWFVQRELDKRSEEARQKRPVQEVLGGIE